ncbi:MAG: hypothetical protein ACFFDE_08810 [Promethearchaeota archaeon]
MKKKITGIVASIFIAVMFAVPVMAESPNKIPVKAIPIIGPFMDIETRVTDGLVHIENLRIEGEIMILPEVGGPLAVGTFVDDPCEGLYNPKTGMSVYTFDEVWTFSDGTFVGTAHVQINGDLLSFTFTAMQAHIVLHGTGDYEGQVLNLKMDWDMSVPGSYGYEGTWLKP